MSEKASKNNTKDQELQDLIDQRIEQKKEEIKKEARKEARKELQNIRPDANRVGDNSEASKGISRRQFLKKAGLATGGLAALMSPVSALDIKSDTFSVETGTDPDDLETYFSVGQGGPVNVMNADLDLNNDNSLVNAESVSADALSGGVLNRSEAITNLEGNLYLEPQGTDPETVLENDGDMVFIHD